MPLPSPADRECLMYLVRHASTASNLARPPRLQGRHVDDPLSEAGRREARQAAEIFRGAAIAAVYASPLRRARETAQIIAQQIAREVQTVSALVEIDVGAWEGRSWDEIMADEPDAYRQFSARPDEVPYRGGESLRDVYQRAAPALEHLMRDHLGQAIIVVAHNIVNRTFLAPLVGLPLARAREVTQDNCGINLIRYANGHVKLRTLNSILHLG